MEHERQAEQLEREADRLDEESGRVERHIEEARRDWESKQHDTSVPGAQPESSDEDEDTTAGIPGDEDEQRGEAGQ